MNCIAGGLGCGESSTAMAEIGSFRAGRQLKSALINVNTAHLKSAGVFKHGR